MTMASRSGDDGNTKLHGGRRVPKDDLRLEAYGAIDELNAALGWARAANASLIQDRALARIQSELFDLGVEVATPRENNPAAEQVAPFPVSALDLLERDLREGENRVAPMMSVVLPGGDELAARYQLARSVCRRAERRVVTLARRERISGVVLRYLNRLGDLLFVLAREANQDRGVVEPEWHSRELREDVDEV